MSNQIQADSRDDQRASQEPSPAMRVLTGEELREIVGGPEIKNGGGGITVTSDLTSATGG